MQTLKRSKMLPFLIAFIGLFSCTTIPQGATAVQPFNSEKYLGKWYEIARIDFKFEKNMNNTTAEYSLNKNGTIKVVNRGYNTEKEEWTEAVGKAKFVKGKDIGMLKVSFFGPFYSGYNVLAVDDNYKYALVGGRSHDFLWILSRETTIPTDVKEDYLKIAKENGYHIEKLLWVEHNLSNSQSN